MRRHGLPRALANGFSLLTVAMFLAVGTASAQEDQLEYNFLGAGARANGMGDAFIAVADDATAIFWNPAGLYLLDQPETSFGFQFASETVEQDRQQTFLLTSDDPGGSASLNFASFVFPKRFGQRKFVFAFAIQKAFDFTAESLAIEARVPFVVEQERNSGGPFSYSGAVAFSPLQGLMLGLSVSLYRGGADVVANQVVTLANGFVQSLSVSGRIPVEGTSIGMGAMYDFQTRSGPPLRLGFKFVPGFDLSGRIHTDLVFRLADSSGLVSEQTPAFDYDYLLDFPLDLGIGLAWNPRRDLLVAADFEHRRFRDAALRVFGNPNVSFDEDGGLTLRLVDELNTLSDSGADLNQWRVGFEWSWVNALTVIPIRVGAKNLPQVGAHERRFVDPETGGISTSFDRQVVGTALTAGVGFVTDAFVFDMSIEYGGWRQEIFRLDSEGTDFLESKTRRLGLRMSLVIYF